MSKFRRGDKVRTIYEGIYYYGEITIVDGRRYKVLFDADSDLNYDYYEENILELMDPESIQDEETE